VRPKIGVEGKRIDYTIKVDWLSWISDLTSISQFPDNLELVWQI